MRAEEGGAPGASAVTRLLRDIAAGDQRAEAELIPVVYKELRRIAARLMRGEARGHTLQTTALVHEAYMRLARGHSVGWRDRTHFFAVAARVMRRVLVDHARARKSAKRGGALEVAWPLPLAPAAAGDGGDQILALDAALDRLARRDARQSRIVELRFFAGLSVDETAAAMKVSPRTIKREWQLAKAFLYGELTA